MEGKGERRLNRNKMKGMEKDGKERKWRKERERISERDRKGRGG